MNRDKGILLGIEYNSPLSKYRYEKITRIVKLLAPSDPVKVDYTLVLDTYYSLYLPAPVVDEKADRGDNWVVVKSILETTWGRGIRSRTVLDSAMSTLTTSLILSKLRERGSGSMSSDINESIDDSVFKHSDVNNILRDISRDVEDVYRLKLILGGSKPGYLSVYSIEEYGLELLRLIQETDVKEILKVLKGIRYEDIVASRKPRVFKKGEKVGYELGSDIERMSPRNLLYGEEVFDARLLQGKLLLYSKVIDESTGTIYVLLDKSGSMEGEKITWAKAVSLALYIKAIKSGKRFYVRVFDNQPHDLVKITGNPGGRDAIRVFEYIARVKSAGGTDITRALMTALSDLEKENYVESSIVLVTDGVDRVARRDLGERFRKTKTSLITVMVKGDNESLAYISREYLRVVKLEPSDVLKVVKVVD